jgi:hypothetical protein
VVMVPEGQETQEALIDGQQLSQNDDNANNTDNNDNNDENDNNNNGDDDEDDEDYTHLSDFEKEKMYHEANEIKTFGNEALIPTNRLRDLLGHIDITTAPEFKIKRVTRQGQEEYRAVVETFDELNVISRHMGPAFRATYKDVVADAAWQAITAFNRTHHDKLKNTVYQLLDQ